MSEDAPSLVLLIPFFASFVVLLVGLKRPEFCWPIAVLTMAGSATASVFTAINVAAAGVLEYRLGGWEPPMGIVFRIDAINSSELILISIVALLALCSAKEEIATRFASKLPAIYTLMLLFTTGVLGIMMTGDAFNLYVLIEVSALTSYALLAQGDRRAAHATLNYVIVGSIGASFYLLGVGYLLIKTGSLNMVDIHDIIRAEGLLESQSIHLAFALIMVGLFIKMALFPMHGWLPNAYSKCSFSASTLIAPIMTKVVIYIMARIVLTVFGIDYILNYVSWHGFVVFLASTAIIGASLLALRQRYFRKMLTYIIVAEVGYMVGGIWLMNRTGFIGALYHIISDGVMTLCLFLAATAIYNRVKDESFNSFNKLFSTMPFTVGCFVVAALSMMGLPPTCGFFSKWYLIGGGIASENYYYVFALIFSSLVNAFLFFRLIEFAYFGMKPSEGHHHHDDGHEPQINEAPFSILIPLMVCAVSLVLIGIFNMEIVSFLESALPHMIFSAQ